MAPAVEEVLRRRRRTYFIDRLIAAFSMSSATAFGCETGGARRCALTLVGPDLRFLSSACINFRIVSGPHMIHFARGHERPPQLSLARHQAEYASPRNLPTQVIQILKTRFSSLRVHRIREVGYAFLDAETRLGPSQFRSHPARRHEQ
jgi:hypothetical protein